MKMAHLPLTKNMLLSAKVLNRPFVNLVNIRNLMSKQLVYNEFGDPLKVVKFKECEVPPLGPQDVLVRMLAAPINPADINTIQGKYPVKVNLPSIPGNEGVGIVEEVGKEVREISAGNKVILTKPVQGTWRNIGLFNKNALKVVPDELGLVEAATLTVNPCTAYRMLTDFQPVKNGLVVIQNGANSACGQNVIQICKAWGVKNINIVRNRPEIDQLKEYLQRLGATYVLTEEELRSTNIFKDKLIEKPCLALNCVGGKSALEMLRHLQHSGKMVTYGGMSREPVSIPTSALIFKNLSFYGFWMTAWNEKASPNERNNMMNDIISMMSCDNIKGPKHKMVKLENYQEAIGNALSPQGFTGCKGCCLPSLPHVPGDEGVGEVVEIGRNVCAVKPGRRVVVTSRFLGTWRYYGTFHERDIHIISPLIPLPEASMITFAPCEAYRMISDFRHIIPGETIIQNAANSPCGQYVIQLCKVWGINTINIVANRCGYQETKQHLLNLGATAVYTLEEAEELTTFDTSVTRPVLALNCLGGRYEDVVLNILDRFGTIIYYGCAYDLPMLKQGCRCDVSFHRFRLCDWNDNATNIEKSTMLNKIIQLTAIRKLKSPSYEPVQLCDYVRAFSNTCHCEAFSSVNYVFDFTIP